MLTSTTAWKSTPLPVVAMVTNTCSINRLVAAIYYRVPKNEHYKSLDLLLFLFSGFVFLSVDEQGKLCLGKFVVSKKRVAGQGTPSWPRALKSNLFIVDWHVQIVFNCSIQCSFISDDLVVSFLSWTILPQGYPPQKRKESWAPTFSASGEVSQWVLKILIFFFHFSIYHLSVPHS